MAKVAFDWGLGRAQACFRWCFALARTCFTTHTLQLAARYHARTLHASNLQGRILAGQRRRLTSVWLGSMNDCSKQVSSFADPSCEFSGALRTALCQADERAGNRRLLPELSVRDEMLWCSNGEPVQAYLLLSIQVWANNGDIQQSLKRS